MTSILTNNSAMNALNTLRTINNNLSSTQDRISTGLKVSSGKDNASYFSISETMSSESGMNKAISEGMTLAKNSVSTARLGAETVVGLARQFAERVAFAQETGVDHAKISVELKSLSDQMLIAMEQSQFNGENLLLDAGAEKAIISGVRDVGGAEVGVSTITVAAAGLGDVQTALDGVVISSDPAALKTAMDTASEQLAAAILVATNLGVAEKAIDTQQKFLSELTTRLDAGVGSMVDADMESEAARLQALQVQQQLATQALSIANQNPQNILSLFR